jgi:hypothetical protein
MSQTGFERSSKFRARSSKKGPDRAAKGEKANVSGEATGVNTRTMHAPRNEQAGDGR